MRQTAVEITQAVRGIMLRMDTEVTPDQLTADATLDSLGLDHMDVRELGLDLEDEFDIDLPAAAVTGTQTVAGLIAAVVEELDKL